eukprot:TRINITY_DN15887_c0_g1_i1.p1 TRINITY_DN15887_c0_g1~~TRINITY_DN15887_c0_g1_i1.p1  ORF type:complete len:331 (-),score=-36.42 TRINITY_DN15887_c0_g1_i1:277-1236(-)
MCSFYVYIWVTMPPKMPEIGNIKKNATLAPPTQKMITFPKQRGPLNGQIRQYVKNIQIQYANRHIRRDCTVYSCFLINVKPQQMLYLSTKYVNFCTTGFVAKLLRAPFSSNLKFKSINTSVLSFTTKQQQESYILFSISIQIIITVIYVFLYFQYILIYTCWNKQLIIQFQKQFILLNTIKYVIVLNYNYSISKTYQYLKYRQPCQLYLWYVFFQYYKKNISIEIGLQFQLFFFYSQLLTCEQTSASFIILLKIFQQIVQKEKVQFGFNNLQIVYIFQFSFQFFILRQAISIEFFYFQELHFFHIIQQQIIYKKKWFSV